MIPKEFASVCRESLNALVYKTIEKRYLFKSTLGLK